MKRKETAFFQQQLVDALLRLMQRNSFEEITISEIAAEADVGRATFYRHFKTKDDLLVYEFKRLTDQWRAGLPALAAMPFLARAEAYLEFLRDNRRYITQLAEAGKLDILEKYLVAVVVKHPEGSVYETYQEYSSAYFFLGVVYVWIRRDFADSPRELMEIMLRAVDVRNRQPR